MNKMPGGDDGGDGEGEGPNNYTITMQGAAAGPSSDGSPRGLHSLNVSRLIETLIKSVWCCHVAQVYLYIMPLSGDWIAGYGDTDNRDTDNRDTDDTGDKEIQIQ